MTNTNGKTAVMTGGTSGLGEAAAVALSGAGWRVLVVGRDAARGAEVVKKLGSGSEFLQADLFSLEDVRRLAGEIQRRAPKLDLLVNNAGGVFSASEPTVDGLERTFALNVAAPFVLTEALVEPLAAARGRVVNVVTGVANGFKASLEQLVGPKAKGGMMAYARNKLALIAVTNEQQKRLGARGITVVALHPGIIPTTRFGHTMTGFNPFTTIGPVMAKLFGFGITAEKAAARFVDVGTAPVEQAGYYYEGKLRPAPKLTLDPEFSSSLWTKLEAVTRGAAA
ncbi:MAG: SDR family NAD(P)-dependent oxidoreductase [Archangium sp.]|nr:SDR family NAD(P)-dependent oxidoreductase [Archangium sp.]